MSRSTIVRRPHSRLRDYLQDYRADRALVHTELHRATVDRIYRQDERIVTWTAHWHQASGTPYLVRRSEFIFPEDTPETVRTAIILAVHSRIPSPHEAPDPEIPAALPQGPKSRRAGTVEGPGN